MSFVRSIMSSAFVVSALVAPVMTLAQPPAQQLVSVDTSAALSSELKSLNISVDQSLIAALGNTMRNQAIATLRDENLKSYLNGEGKANGNLVAQYLLQDLKATENGAFGAEKTRPNLAKLAQEYAEGGVISTVTEMYARFNTIIATHPISKTTGKPKVASAVYGGVRRDFFKKQAVAMGKAKAMDADATAWAQKQEQAAAEAGCGI